MMIPKTLLIGLAMSTFAFTGCDKDDNNPVSYDYHAHIVQPSASDKSIGETLFIDVEFESHTGENVEHINVRIYKADNSVEVYNEPGDPHVAGEVSSFDFTDQFVLSAANGITHGDWVLEATVWGEDEGQDLETERVEFHINP